MVHRCLCLECGHVLVRRTMYPMITGMEFLRFYVMYGPRTVFQRGMHGVPQCVLRPALDAYAETSSTGMTQKLYLTGLLLQDNAVLLLEEQSSSLDFRLSKVCFDAVHGDHYSEGAPYLMPLARREASAGLC